MIKLERCQQAVKTLQQEFPFPMSRSWSCTSVLGVGCGRSFLPVSALSSLSESTLIRLSISGSPLDFCWGRGLMFLQAPCPLTRF